MRGPGSLDPAEQRATAIGTTPHDSVDADQPDGALIKRAIAGDLAAYNQIVLRYQRSVLTHSVGILRDVGLAEDVTQETFLRAWNALASFDGESARPWLLRIATNRCFDLLRQRNRQATGSIDAQPVEVEPVWSTRLPEESPESTAEHAELTQRLERLLNQLPDDQRVAILMADVLGYDYAEIAELTGIALGTVKSRISRARARLRTSLLADHDSREHFERFVRP